MKKNILNSGLIFLLLFCSLQIFAQVAINVDGNPPDPSAMLDVRSAIKGFLPPRVALTSTDVSTPVATPVAVGLLVFNTATHGTSPNNVAPGYYYWSGLKWIPVATPPGVNPGEMLYWNGSSWVIIPTGEHGQQLYFCNGQPTWGGCFALIVTASPVNVTYRSAVAGGNVTSDGGSQVTERGVCWSTSPNPTISGSKICEGSGTGVFNCNVSGLTANTLYHMRAYATNSKGTTYGNDVTFTTSEYSGAPETTIPELEACPGSSVDVPVTVQGFNSIGAFVLTLHYNATVLTYTGASNTSGFPGLVFDGTQPGTLTVTSSTTSGISYADDAVLFTMHFLFGGGSANLEWFDDGPSCAYYDAGNNILDDLPTANYYINGKVDQAGIVGIPQFSAGATSSRCQGAGSVSYSATAANSFGITYGLDGVSLAAGNSINTNTGTVNYSASWIGTSVITASAAGCEGPKTAEHTVTIDPLLPVSISVTAASNPVCAGTLVAFTAVAINGGSDAVYQWNVNGIDVGTNTTIYSYIPADNDIIKCRVTSNAHCNSGSPSTSAPVTMHVNPLLPVSVSISASSNPVCEGVAVTFTASGANGGNTPGYQWFVNGNSTGTNSSVFTYNPDDNDAVQCKMTSNATCVSGNPANSNVITMEVNELLPVLVSITPTANPVCGGTEVTYTATGVHAGTNPVFQWKVNGNYTGANSPVFSYIPSNNDIVSCSLHSSAACVTGNPAASNQIVMDVNLLFVAGSISQSQTICELNPPAELKGVPPLTGTSPVYQWQRSTDNTTFTDIDGATQLDYFPGMLTVKTYFRQIQNATGTCGGPLPTNVVTITVNQAVNANVSIAADKSGTICAGTSVVFTATPVNGGTTPVYHWKVNGDTVGSTNSTYVYTPSDGDAIHCSMNSDLFCVTNNPASSNTITMSVNNTTLYAGVTIAANPTGAVYEGTLVAFTAIPENGGTSPAYQWQVNGVNVGTNNISYSYKPQNNDVVKCILTSNAPCIFGNPAISNNIIMVVHPLLIVSVTISASINPVCAGTSVTYSASPENGGTLPVFQWKVNGNNAGTNSPTYTYIPASGDIVTCVLTSDISYAINNPAVSNAISMTVNASLPVGVNISANPSGPVCDLTMVTFSATATNGGSAPIYQWLKNNLPVSGATNASYSYTPANNDEIKCTLTSNAQCAVGNPATSSMIKMTVNANLPVSITISPSANPVCSGSTVTLNSNVVNGGSSPAYQWKVNGSPVTGATNAVYTYQPINNDAVTCILTSNAVCATGSPATSNVVNIVVNPLLPVSITVSASSNPVCAGSSVTYTTSITNGGTTPLYQWKLNGSNVSGATNPSYNFVPANGNVVSCVLTSNTACASGNPATSNQITMTVNPLLPVSLTISASATSVCPGTSVTFSSSITNGGTAPLYQWRINGMDVQGATNSTYIYNVNSNDLVTCVLTSNATCPSGNPATSNTISMTVNPYLPVSVTVTASSPIVIGNPVTFTAAPVNGGTTPAYQWKVNGTNAGTNNSVYTYTPAANDQVTTVLTSTATCALGTPATSNAVIILSTPASAGSVTISPSTNSVCAGTTVVFTATPVNGGTTPAYQWKLGGTNITGATNATYSFVPVHGNVITCTLTPSGGTAVTSNAVTMSVIANAPVSVLVTASAYGVMPGTSVTFTAAPANQGTAPSYQWKVNTTNTGTNSPTYTYTPSNNDKVVCVVTSNSNASCLTNNPATSNKIITVVYTTGTACTGIPTLTYGGITYNTVQIGTQCWMRENLNIGNRVNNSVVQTNNSIVEKYCYNDSIINCSLYGGLYQWNEVMQYVTTAGAQGICPTGWHIPTDAEFATLSTFVGGDATAGSKLKESGTAHFRAPNTNATNEYGFTALPSGYSYNNSSFNSMFLNGYFHMSAQNSSTDVWFRSVISTTESLNRYLNYKTTAIPVRCLKN